jgi:hypothetical protein
MAIDAIAGILKTLHIYRAGKHDLTGSKTAYAMKALGVPALYDVATGTISNGILDILKRYHCSCPPFCDVASPTMECNFAVVYLHIICRFFDMTDASLKRMATGATETSWMEKALGIADGKAACAGVSTVVDYQDWELGKLETGGHIYNLLDFVKTWGDAIFNTPSDLQLLLHPGSLFTMPVLKLALDKPDPSDISDDYITSMIFGSKGISTGRAAFDALVNHFSESPALALTEHAAFQAELATRGVLAYLPDFIKTMF